jgi:hypothetical protein
VLAPGEIDCFMPAPGGPTVPELEAVLRGVAARRPVTGLGLTGLRPEADLRTLARLTAAAGF